MNHLYFGDCLDVLKDLSKRYPKPFIDLIYIDPPFNSKRNYNVLFEKVDLKDVVAQKHAFTDTWSNVFYLLELNDLSNLDKGLFDFLSVLNNSNSISKSAVAYLTTMSNRIWYMHKLLKNTGSFFLHCDPTMSHFLKIICDIIFGQNNFKNEIIWQRTSTHNDAKQGAKHFGRIHDVILFYSKSKKQSFNTIYKAYSNDYIKKAYNKIDNNGRRFKASDMSGPGGASKGNPIFTWNGIRKHWRYSYATMKKLHQENKIYYSSNGMPYLKHYIDEMKGISVDDLWSDIKPASRTERIGYPTQKPENLLERIIKSCTQEGDLVADFFCGCGTAVSVSQRLNRKWLGVDISHLAVQIIEKRLLDTYGLKIKRTIQLHGFPKDIESVKMLARNKGIGAVSFKEWIIEVLLHGVANEKNKRIISYDGYLPFNFNGEQKFALIKAKSTKVSSKDIQSLNRAVVKQKATLGLFICFEDSISRSILKKAETIGFFNNKYDIDKIQVLTVESLMDGKQPSLPLKTSRRLLN